MTTLDSHSDTAAHGHSPHLAHHFDTPVQQFESAVLGMWLFLATEILLFGGLFCAYAVYRANHPEIFAYAHVYLSKPLGAVNTVILLVSSFTMAAGVWAAQQGRRRLLVAMLALTIACGVGFLGIKVVEYEHKWKEGLLWGKHYRPPTEPVSFAAHHAAEHGQPLPAEEIVPPPTPEALSLPAGEVDPGWVFQPADDGPRGLLAPGRAMPVLAEETPVRNVQTFFAIYFAMTGLHGLHVIVGLALIAWLLVRAVKGHFSPAYFTPVPMVGLYWHVVDMIWIYLFPLLYLIH